MSFSAKTLYIADNISRQTLQGSEIGISPIITNQKLVTNDSLGIDKIWKLAVKLRSDLLFQNYFFLKRNYLSAYSDQQCDSIFLSLHKKTTLQIQNDDTLWNHLQCDYLIVLFIRDAMNIKTFDNVNKKRLLMEAEMWNCKDQETVWRYQVTGTADGKKIEDRQFIDYALQMIFLNLPKSIHSYEKNDKW